MRVFLKVIGVGEKENNGVTEVGALGWVNFK
jgi:hypothetical protein